MGQKDSQDSRIHGFVWGKKIHRIHGFTDSVGAKSNQRIQDSRIRLGQKDSQERIHGIHKNRRHFDNTVASACLYCNGFILSAGYTSFITA